MDHGSEPTSPTPATPGERTRVQLSSEQIRTLAHPLRARLLGLLRLDGAATATGLAAALGTNSGATSYHLRSLAQVGLVVEEPGRRSGRERWWRAAHEVSSFQSSDYAEDPDAAAAVDWFQDYGLRMLATRFAEWTQNRDRFSPEWQDAAGVNDLALRLTPEQLGKLTEEIWQVILRYDRDSQSVDPTAEQVVVGYLAFPRRSRSATPPR